MVMMTFVASNKTTEAVLVFVALLFLVIWLVLMIPHYDQTMNRIRTGLFAVLLELAAFGVVSAAWRPQGTAADVLTGTSLLLSFAAFLAGFRCAGTNERPCFVSGS